MNIEQANKLKAEMESDICDTINGFIEITGLKVTYIDLNFVSQLGMNTNNVQKVTVEVTLP